MRNKTILGAALAAMLMGLGATAAQAQVYVQVAPPAPRHEAVPAARPGHVWSNGHYEWRGNQYVWVPGHWIEARRGYEWREPRWVQRGNGQWYMVGGNWERGPYGDRDHDGVPNRYDRHGGDYNQNHRMGPYGDLDRDGIQNRRDGDRDGDGVSNYRDRFPDNYRRS